MREEEWNVEEERSEQKMTTEEDGGREGWGGEWGKGKGIYTFSARSVGWGFGVIRARAKGAHGCERRWDDEEEGEAAGKKARGACCPGLRRAPSPVSPQSGPPDQTRPAFSGEWTYCG